jgi:hypothetical protein
MSAAAFTWSSDGSTGAPDASYSRTKTLFTARAYRPVNVSVIVVSSPPELISASLYMGGAIDSRHATNRVPSRTPEAPNARDATRPRPSAMLPAAITGWRTASAICGTSAMVPIAASPGDGLFRHVDR